MARITQLKIVYFGILLTVVGLAFGAGLVFRNFFIPFVVIALAVFIPQRLQAAAYRDLFQAQRLLAAGRTGEAVELTRRFLEMIRRHPEKKRLMWMTGSRYTSDVEALALNNLGTAHLERAEWDDARAAFESAAKLDAGYSVPRFNLAVLAGALGDRAEADRRLREAKERGYSNPGVDKVMKLGASVRDRAEGKSAAGWR